MLSVYSFDIVLSRMTSKYREFHNTNKTIPTGLRYFSNLEQILELGQLSDSNKLKKLAYISKN